MNKDIIQLVKEKKYDEIYEKYGTEMYLLLTPRKYKNKDIDQLLKEGRFLDIYEKYGERIYKANLEEIREKDIENELGIHFQFNNYLFFENLKSKLKITQKNIVVTSIIMSIYVTTGVSNDWDDTLEKNSVIYQSEINDYDQEIEKYADYINSLHLSDLEIIMKVMNDMWSNIEGYKDPDHYNIRGYDRLSIYMDGYGVCRNMADDFTARMNAINPDYEACNLIVFLKNIEIDNIKNKIVREGNATGLMNSTNNQSDEQGIKNIQNIIGNHMVSCIRLKEDDVLLIVDPTNPSIGVLKNGEITMLSNQMMKGIKVKPIGNLVLGSDNRKEYLKKLTESLFTTGDIDTLKEKYGITSQNETLEEIIEKYSTSHYHTRKR